MLKAYKYEIYPTGDEEILMGKHFGCTRLLFNIGLTYRQYSWQGGVSVGYHDTSRELKVLKKEYPFLNEVNSQSLQKALMNLDESFSKFFNKKGGYPVMKSKHSKQSFHCPQNVKVCLSKGLLFLPKFKNSIKANFHRKFKGEIRSCTISKTPTGRYIASILVDNKKPLPELKPVLEDTSVGLDLGLKSFVITSDKVKINNPRYLRKSFDKIKWLQKQLSNKPNLKSNRRKKLKNKLAKAHEKVANQRKDFLHKESNEITNHYDTVCTEDLKVKNMMKRCKPKQDENGKYLPNGQAAKSGLNKSISDAGWGMFKTFLKYKCEHKGKNFLQIGTFEPSSKRCHPCGFINKNLKLEDRTWICPCCGTLLDRDENAASNVKTIAIEDWRAGRSLQDAEATPTPKPKGKGRIRRKRTDEALKVQNNALQVCDAALFEAPMPLG